MIAKLKCLGKLLVAIVLSLIFLELCECKPDFGVEVTDGVGIAGSDNDKLTSAVEPSLANEEGSQAGKRGWSSFNSWGKRGWNKNFAVWGKRKWNNFAPWGKREDPNDELSSHFAQINPEKRDWSSFASWGKRTDEDRSAEAMDKRKWNSFHTWGKRNKEDFQDQLEIDKKWSQFAPWGKRDDDDESEILEKRRWSQFNSWGKKRNPESMDGQRKWSQFVAWGKRNLQNSGDYPAQEHLYSEGDDMSIPVDKRRWSQFASWGKRLRNAKTLAALNSWGKRRWPGLATWGKRSTDMNEPNTKEIAQKLLQIFDENGDGTLDITELNNYLGTLASLPSSEDAAKQDALEM